MELTRNSLEGVVRTDAAGELVQPTLLDRVGAAALLLARFVPSTARGPQRHLGVGADRQPFLLALEQVLPEPALRAVGCDFQVQSAAASQADTAFALCVKGGSAIGIGEHGEQALRGTRQKAACSPASSLLLAALSRYPSRRCGHKKAPKFLIYLGA